MAQYGYQKSIYEKNSKNNHNWRQVQTADDWNISPDPIEHWICNPVNKSNNLIVWVRVKPGHDCAGNDNIHVQRQKQMQHRCNG